MRQPEAAGNSDPLENFRSRPGQQVYPAPAEIRLSPAGSGSTPSRADGQPVPRGLPADTLNWRNSAPAPAPAPSHPRPPETLHSPAPLAPMRLAPPRPAGAVGARCRGARGRHEAAGPWALVRTQTQIQRHTHRPPPRPVRTLTPQGHPSGHHTAPSPPPATCPRPPAGRRGTPTRPPACLLPVRMHALACPHSLALAPSPSPPPPPALTPALAVSVGAAHARRRLGAPHPASPISLPGARRVPHDHAVRDGGEAAPHPSAPPAPNHERRSSPGPPADGRAAGYREPTEAPAALRYRYV
ncbi:atherin-like [Melospiza georgiana]|uniref:atherin-like n=1 Tax=Melospiza georgiana TaxID=44398 RepID=UPI0025AC6087|nr:atherin-like [Melospiza georgiana]